MIQDILTVAKKELKSAFSDKAILALIIFVPFLIVFGYTLLMTSTAGAVSVEETPTYVIYSVNTPDFMTEHFKRMGITEVTEDRIDQIKADIETETADLLIKFPENFAFAEIDAEEIPNINMWYSSSKSDSLSAFNQINAYLKSYQPTLYTINSAYDKEEEESKDLGDEYHYIRQMLGTILPIFILMAVFMVCMNLAAESIAGDKERGFLNTMLIAPVKRSSLAAGKALCIFVAAIIGGISAFIGMAVSMPKFADTFGIEEGISYSFVEYLLLFAVTITAIFALTGVLLLVSTLSKDVKQATNIAPIFFMVLMVAGMLKMSEDIAEKVDALGMTNAYIPAWNTMVVMQDIIELDYSPAFAIISSLVNIVFAAICIFVMGKLFENEKIVNG